MTVPPEENLRRRSPWRAALVLIGGLVAAMWLVEAIDAVVLDNELDRYGIIPRRQQSLDGVIWAPMLHGSFAHLLGNTLPFVVLGALVASWGVRRWLAVTLIVVVLGGGLTWLFGREAVHIGASGVVFGYFGFLLGAVFFERALWPLVPATIAIVAFGGAIASGVVPTEGVSWESHVFGVFAGVVAARLTARPDAGNAPDLLLEP